MVTKIKTYMGKCIGGEVGGFKHLHVETKQPNRASWTCPLPSEGTDCKDRAWFQNRVFEELHQNLYRLKTPYILCGWGKFVNVWCECEEKKKNNNKYFSESFKAQAALCARGMCIEEVCDARIGMCVHVGVSLMHSCGRCVFPVSHQPWSLWLLSGLMLLPLEPQTANTGLHAKGLPVTNGHYRHTKASLAVQKRGITIQVKLWCSCT